MRLDHLLSKEHLARRVLRGGMGPGAGSRRTFSPVAHGWNIDSAVGSAASDLSTPGPSWFGLERVGGERVGWCTLLGPEGPGFPAECGRGLSRDWGLWVLVGFFGGPHEAGSVVPGGVWCRSYVENYTVDASILDRS